VTKLTSCVKLRFNNIGPFIVRLVIFTVVSPKLEQNAREGQQYKENWEAESNSQQQKVCSLKNN
jgi:hypothetical protein